MFSNLTIAIVAAIATGAWIYAKTQRKTGGNMQSSLIVAGSGAGLMFLAVLVLLNILF